MNIERIREVLSKIKSTNTDAGHNAHIWREGFDSGVAEVLKAIETEAKAELIFSEDGSCNILGGK